MDSGLIQMNAHMVVTDGAKGMIWAGLILAVVFAIIGVCAIREKSWKFCAVFAIFAIVSAAMFVTGLKTPRVKEIRTCAVGPVSLEQVGTIYDIVNVDGKELTLRTR